MSLVRSPFSLTILLFLPLAAGAQAALDDAAAAGSTETSPPLAHYEPPPTLNAADLLPASALSGPHHRVQDRVPTDGFLTRFTIDSDFGSFSPGSPALAQERVKEIAALAELARLDTDDLAKDGFKHAAGQLKDSFQHLIENPDDTLKGVPDGVGRFFKRTVRAAKTGYQAVQDRHAGDSAPAAVTDGPGSRLPGAPLEVADPVPDESSAELAAKLAGRTAADVFGYSEQRREIAARLGVDPYSDNAVLARRLDEVAWAAFSGGLGVAALKALAPATSLITATASASDWVWETPPGDLRVYNEHTLLGLGASQQDVDRFLRHPFYTLSLQTRLVKALDALSGVAGRADIMPLALSVTSTGQARFVVESAEMLARIHAEDGPVQRMSVDGTLIGWGDDAALLVPAPVDALSWSEPLDGFASRLVGAAPTRRLYVRGAATTLAQEQLSALGWTLVAWP